LFRNFPKAEFIPKPFGPAFRWQDDHSIIITQGKLKDREFTVEQETTDTAAQLKLFLEGKQIGHCLVEYGKNSFIEIWDMVIDKRYQQNGLAALTVKILVRELLFKQDTTRVKMRTVKLFEPDAIEVNLINVGSGLIAHRLGMTCEFDIEKLIQQKRVKNIDVIFTIGPYPPAFKIVLDTFPHVLVAFVVDAVSEKPIFDQEIYTRFRNELEVIMDWSRRRQLVIGNADYYVYDDGINDFINCIAGSKTEADLLRVKIFGYSKL